RNNGISVSRFFKPEDLPQPMPTERTRPTLLRAATRPALVVAAIGVLASGWAAAPGGTASARRVATTNAALPAVPDTTAAPTGQPAAATPAPDPAAKTTRTKAIRASAQPATTSSVAPAAVGAANPVSATLGAKQLTGPGTMVADPQASTGSAVMIKSGTLKGATSLVAGAYVLSARVRSAGERMALSANGLQVG